MRIVGRVTNQTVVILIDRRSTQNFLDPSIVSKIHLLLHRMTRIKFQVANGEELLSELRQVHWCECKNAAIFFHVKAFFIVLAGCDMVLGIQ
jgi:hypothetical protein